MKADDSLVLMKCFFNQGLVMFDKDKEMEVFLSNETTKGENSRT